MHKKSTLSHGKDACVRTKRYKAPPKCLYDTLLKHLPILVVHSVPLRQVSWLRVIELHPPSHFTGKTVGVLLVKLSSSQWRDRVGFTPNFPFKLSILISIKTSSTVKLNMQFKVKSSYHEMKNNATL
jgi:hypothetical protein